MSAGFRGLIDYTGLIGGQGAPIPAPVAGQGFRGLLDYTGLTAGQGFAVPTPPAVGAGQGFLGSVDFVGYALGPPQVPPPLHRHGSFRGAGRRLYTYEVLRRHYLNRIRREQRPSPMRIVQSLRTHMEYRQEQQWQARKSLIEKAAWATVFALV